MKNKRQKIVGWSAYGVSAGDAFVITVNSRTRREAIALIERLTGVPIVRPSDVKRCAVMPAEYAPKSLMEIDWDDD